jgi:hypothetical protein
MKRQFGDTITSLRDPQNLYFGQVFPLLEMKTAQLSEIENGMRQLKTGTNCPPYRNAQSQ